MNLESILRLYATTVFVGLLIPLNVQAQSDGSGLTESQRRSGWKMLFDGKSLEGWRSYGKPTAGEGWTIRDGVLSCSNGSGDLVTQKQYASFELMLEYRITQGGNSGVLFHVVETSEPSWHTGPEIQLFDDQGRPGSQRSGWLYELYKPVIPVWADQSVPMLDASRPAGQWNQLYLRVTPRQSEVDLNGMLYYLFRKGDAEWNAKVAASKFAQLPGFGKANTGHIALQEHGSETSFRNIRIREIAPDGSVPKPIDGKLSLRSSLAFPKLKWKDWEPIDEGGNIRELRLMELTSSHDRTNRLFAASQSGVIFVFDNKSDVVESKIFLDIREKVAQWSQNGNNEMGLLGLAFHPNYANNGQFFVHYSHSKQLKSVISRFRVSSNDPNRADPNSETVLLEIPQPYKNHKGGSMEFGPDGYLYTAMGDGGDRNDPTASGQDLTSLLGKVLRIDVNRQSDGRPYAIPADNPFVSAADKAAGRRGEIFAYGVRNIWRMAFDPKTGTLWAGDVGQELSEEINLIRSGGNYGWSIREGFAPFGNRPTTAPTPPIDPIWEYDHQIGRSITGGRVYRSDRLTELVGKYIYADYVNGFVWALEYDERLGKVIRNDEIISNGTPIMAFGQDDSGEVYFMNANSKGECIYRFERVAQ